MHASYIALTAMWEANDTLYAGSDTVGCARI